MATKKTKHPIKEKPNHKSVFTGKPRLSVCMIVKDEEKMLADCLASVRHLYDELIVVDTGSSDRTPEIAKEFGAQVFHHPWKNNFSLHRNQSIGYATGDWILQIDADERLDTGSRKLLLETMHNAPAEVNGYCIVIQDYKRDGKQSVRFNYPRLFRNRIGVKYEAVVHNQVIIPGKVDFSEVRLNHFGYDLDAASMLKKFRRSVRLLRKEARENPDDPRAFYYLANAYSQYHRFPKAVEYARKTLEILRRMPSAPPYYLSIYHGLIGGLIALEKLDEARDVCNEAIQVRDDYVDAYYHLARLNYMQKNFAETIETGQKYLELADFYNGDASRLEVINYYTLDRVYRVKFWIGISQFAQGNAEHGMASIESGLAEKELDHTNVLEMIHNAFAVSPIQNAKEIVKKAFERNQGSTTFFYFLIQELAAVDMLIVLPDLVARLDDDSAIRRDKFAEIIYNLCSVQNEKALEKAGFFLQGHKQKIHAELCEFVLQAAGSRSMQPQDSLASNFPQLPFINLVNSVMRNDFNMFNLALIDDVIAEENSEKELQIMAYFLRLHHSILENDADGLVQYIGTLIQLTGFSEGPALEDIEDLKRILVGLIRKADQLLCADAGDLGVKIGENFFADDPLFMSFKYRRDILRSKRRGPYNTAVRLYFKYLFLPKMQWLSTSESQMRTRKQGKVFDTLLGYE
ncbi:glycosyltransferase [candidate division KSB1 bacterium]|nr:glycosyltransferase [candidate division KSB1 bacterium]